MTERIYFDWNGHAPLVAAAKAAMCEMLALGNASAVHADGREARRHIETARRVLADSLGADSANIIFTASGTEANNLALHNARGRPVLLAASEHESVLRPALEQQAILFPLDSHGLPDLLGLEEALTRHPRAFVAAMLANNETGVLWPIAEIAALVHRHGGLLHCDASQAFGRMPVDIDALGADFLTVSAHKMGGPLGAAALVLARDQAIVPLLQGGGQERGRRAGTENGPALVGFAAAILDGYRDWQKTRRLRDHLEDIVREVDPRARIFGEDRARLDNTTCFALSAGSGHSLVIACDLAGIGISAGAACSSGTVKPSRVLQAMGVDEATARRALRISLGPTNTEDEVSRFRQVVRERCGMLESAA